MPPGVVTNYCYDDEGHVLTVTRNAGQTGAVRYDYTYDPAFPDKVASVTPKNPTTNVARPLLAGLALRVPPSGLDAPRRPEEGLPRRLGRHDGGLRQRVRVRRPGARHAPDDGRWRADRLRLRRFGQPPDGHRPRGLRRPPRHHLRARRPRPRHRRHRPARKGDALHLRRPRPGADRHAPADRRPDLHHHLQLRPLRRPAGLLYTEITDPNGRLTRLGYDVDGRLRRSVDAAGGATVYAYSGRLLTTITDPNGNVTTYGYDAAKRLASTSFPDGGQETYTYWNDGLLKTKTDRRGTTVTYAYDAFKRLETKSLLHRRLGHLHLRGPEAPHRRRHHRHPRRDPHLRLRPPLPSRQRHAGRPRHGGLHLHRRRPRRDPDAPGRRHLHLGLPRRR